MSVVFSQVQSQSRPQLQFGGTSTIIMSITAKIKDVTKIINISFSSGEGPRFLDSGPEQCLDKGLRTLFLIPYYVTN